MWYNMGNRGVWGVYQFDSLKGKLFYDKKKRIIRELDNCERVWTANNGLRSYLVQIEEDIDELKENTEITRETTNELVKWAETAGEFIRVRFQSEDYK